MHTNVEGAMHFICLHKYNTTALKDLSCIN